MSEIKQAIGFLMISIPIISLLIAFVWMTFDYAGFWFGMKYWLIVFAFFACVGTGIYLVIGGS